MSMYIKEIYKIKMKSKSNFLQENQEWKPHLA